MILRPGEKLGRYELRAALGSGGMSAVYLAYDPVLDRDVAIKILPPELGRDRTLRRRFREEARALGRVQHPNLVRIYAVGEEGPLSFYTMERVAGKTLRRAVSELGRLTANQAVAVFSQFLRGLDACHRRGIIHRDVKPSNIMLASSGRVILMDFGLARRVERQSFTAAGAVLGTPEYMSPEQASGKPADERADLYSAGVVLFEMLAGRPPFQGKDTIAVLRHHVETPAPSVRAFSGDVPPGLEGVVARLLAKKPEERYAHVGAVADAVAGVAALDEPAERIVKELLAAAAAAGTRPTRAYEAMGPALEGGGEAVCAGVAVPGAGSASVEARSQPSGAVRPDGRVSGGGIGPWVAVGSAVVAVLALILALGALWGAIRSERTRSGGRGGPGAGSVAPVVRRRAIWRVELKNGRVLRGQLRRSGRGEGEELIFVLGGTDGRTYRIPYTDVKALEKEKGGETE